MNKSCFRFLGCNSFSFQHHFSLFVVGISGLVKGLWFKGLKVAIFRHQK
ncbi:hypothetical protein CIPAW_11G136100 [Carya illinoinensis]|uniref:Uncharacterized protein n=1 Tax=Carya illinoinensis TaxID=32201 RepID=A0A8T1P7A8_CARIL|nr:hypothetical protein CIPAW_11G136100 [Carya illinoinensis]